MRELNQTEVSRVSGGFVGTPIPFYNGFIPGANWPGGGSGAVTAASVAWTLGFQTGAAIYDWTTDAFGISIGEALYLTTH